MAVNTAVINTQRVNFRGQHRCGRCGRASGVRAVGGMVFFDGPPSGRRVFFCVPTYVTKTPKKQVWQHSYTRVRRPLIIARLTQRTPCPGIWSECRSYALLHEGSLPEVTGSSPIKFGDLPVLSTVIRPFFFVFWLYGRRGGKNQASPEHQEPGTNTRRARGADFTGRRPWSIAIVPTRS